MVKKQMNETKRELNQEEKTLCEKNIYKLTQRNNNLTYYVKYYNLMLTQGLKVNYEMQLAEFKQKLKDVNEEIHTNNLIIINTQKQIEEGVEIKNKEVKE